MFNKIYKIISKIIRDSFFYEIDPDEQEKYLEKLNLVAVKRCAYETLACSNDEDFLIKNSTPSKVKKEYNLKFINIYEAGHTPVIHQNNLLSFMKLSYK